MPPHRFASRRPLHNRKMESILGSGEKSTLAGCKVAVRGRSSDPRKDARGRALVSAQPCKGWGGDDDKVRLSWAVGPTMSPATSSPRTAGCLSQMERLPKILAETMRIARERSRGGVGRKKLRQAAKRQARPRKIPSEIVYANGTCPRTPQSRQDHDMGDPWRILIPGEGPTWAKEGGLNEGERL
jgi:hypothetical protein